MKTLIVLCAGNHMLDKMPAYLNRYPDGKLLAEKTIEGIYPESYDRIIFTILETSEFKYNAKQILLNELKKYPIEVMSLPNYTSGPAESLYKTIIKAQVNGEFVARDSLNYIKLQQNITGNFIVGLNIAKYHHDVLNVRSKSFIIINEQSQVLDIIEKRFRSDIISTGMYGFKNVNDFIMAYSRLNDKNYSIKQLYLSHIISYLIGYKKRLFQCVTTEKFEDWSSDEAWNVLQKHNAVYFANLDLFLDNTKTEHFNINALNKLQKCSNMNQNFIFYTSKKEIDAYKIKAMLLRHGINCMYIIMDIPFSKLKYMINTIKDLDDISLGG